MRLSVLDLIGVRTGQTAAQALRASRDLIEAADRLGYHRYWVAEHHNTPAVASTSPAGSIEAAASGDPYDWCTGASDTEASHGCSDDGICAGSSLKSRA